MKWQLSLLSLTSLLLPAVLAAPAPGVETTTEDQNSVRRSEPAANNNDDDAVELLWGHGHWQYSASKRDEEDAAAALSAGKDHDGDAMKSSSRSMYGPEKGSMTAEKSDDNDDDDKVELLWGSGRWQYGGSKRDEEHVPQGNEGGAEKDDDDDDKVELLWGSGRWQYGGSKRDEEQK
ncbi:hypothetical protein GGR50DRAFT_158469 [Xylaria sp. CBS 124048]|nr:hypothetical protein GGR50DRAFT_158469 [Xylaria sp. CBS 124048]